MRGQPSLSLQLAVVLCGTSATQFIVGFWDVMKFPEFLGGQRIQKCLPHPVGDTCHQVEPIEWCLAHSKWGALSFMGYPRLGARTGGKCICFILSGNQYKCFLLKMNQLISF